MHGYRTRREDHEPSGPVWSSSLHLVDDVAFLHEDAAVFDAMLQGWSAQQISGRAKGGVCDSLSRDQGDGLIRTHLDG